MSLPNKPFQLLGEDEEDQPQPTGTSLSALPPGGSRIGVDPLELKRVLATEREDPSYTGGRQNPFDTNPLAGAATDMVGYGLAQQGAKLALLRLAKLGGPTASIASIAAGPIYEGVKGAVIGRDPMETLEQMGEAALWGVGIEGGIAGLKGLFKGGGSLYRSKVAPALKEGLGKAADLPLARPLKKMFPQTFHGESMRELFQPVIERAEPRLKGALARKELITDISRQAVTETSKRMEGMSLEEKYHVAEFLKEGRFTPNRGTLTTSFMKMPLDAKQRITHALEPLETWRVQAGKIDPKRDLLRELELHKQIQGSFLPKLAKEGSVLDSTYLSELEPFVKGKGGVEQARKAFSEVMEHPAVSDEAKLLAKDLYLLHHTVAESFPSAIQHAEKNVLFAKLRSNPNWVAVKQRPGMVESTHPAFKGLYVTKDVDQAIKDYEYVPAFFTRAFNTYFTTPWKMNKVVLRVPTHFRNIFSNVILNDVGGLPWYRMDLYKKSMQELRANSSGVKEFARLSGVGTTFAEVETAPLLRQLHKSTDLMQASNGYLSQLAGAAGEKGLKGAEAFNRAYMLEEVWAKYAKYLHNLELGMNKKLAAEDATKWTFNYGRVTPLVRTMRESVAPFATWTTKVIPLMAEAAIDHPLRVAKWMLMPYAITQMATKTARFSDKEWNQAKQDLPDYLSQGIVGLAPFRDSEGRAQLINYTWFLPGIGDMAGLFAGMGSAKNMAQTLTQNPLISIAADLKHNRTLSGAPIYYEWEPTDLKMQKLLAYVHLQLGPGIIGTDIAKIMKAMQNSPEALTNGQLFANNFGVPIMPLVPRELKRKKVLGQQIAIREMMSRARNEMVKARTPADKQAVVMKYRGILGGFVQDEIKEDEE